MKKRIRITESQLAEIAKRMDETVFSTDAKKITKKEIKEARLNKLVKESVRMFKKKNLI